MFHVEVKGPDGNWGRLHPSGEPGKPYAYPTWQEADDAFWACYPDEYRLARLGESSAKIRIVEER